MLRDLSTLPVYEPGNDGCCLSVGFAAKTELLDSVRACTGKNNGNVKILQELTAIIQESIAKTPGKVKSCRCFIKDYSTFRNHFFDDGVYQSRRHHNLHLNLIQNLDSSYRSTETVATVSSLLFPTFLPANPNHGSSSDPESSLGKKSTAQSSKTERSFLRIHSQYGPGISV